MSCAGQDAEPRPGDLRKERLGKLRRRPPIRLAGDRPGHGGPWRFVPVARVPRPIIAVPNAYLYIPRGRGHHIAGPAPWNGHAVRHGHGQGNGHWKH